MNREPRKIAILHHAGGGNFGDDAEIASVIDNIRSRWPNTEITVFSMNPEDTAKKHGVTSYPIRRHTWTIGYQRTQAAQAEGQARFLQRIRTTRNPAIRLPRAVFDELKFLIGSRQRIKKFDFLIVSGGGHLTERGGTWAFPYAILSWFAMAKSAGVKCVLLNVGAGPLIKRLSKYFVRRALSLAKYVSFRDEQSQALAESIGFKGTSYVFPDNVYASQPPSIKTLRRDSKIVGIAPMPFPADPPFDSKTRAMVYRDVITRFAMFASTLVERSYPITLFGTDIGSDPAAIEDLREQLRDHHSVDTRPYEPVYSLDELLRQMSALDYVVTCRFHGVVFAHLLNKPVLAVSHHPKVTHLMQALGLSDYCVDIRTFDPADLAGRFDSMVKNRREIKTQMSASLTRYKELLKSQFDELWPTEMKESMALGQVR
jgi:polysaccharide pyruvyl transferase WcaK-like protein